MSVLPVSAEIIDRQLWLGGLPASDLAGEFGTPLFVYCEHTLRERAAAYVAGIDSYPFSARLVYACKANATVGVLRVILAQGLGADVASAGELVAALRAGADPAAIVVHGNNKSDDDLAAAIGAGAGLVVIDHMGEAAQIERIAAEAGRVQRVLVRVTPGIEAETHHKIATGHHGSKFGLAPADALDALDAANGMAHLHPAGLHVHLGSQIHDTGTYTDAVDWLVSFIEDNGLGELGTLDLGGGFAIAHRDEEIELPVEEGVEQVVLHLAERLIAHGLPMPELILEPGRSIAGPSGVTLYTVGAIKQVGDGTVFAAVDGGMSDNPRPALYGARYEAIVCDRADAPPQRSYDIAGKHCETGDVLIEDAYLPELRPGDVLAVPATGAYNASMASNYNQLPRPAAVLVEDGSATLIQRRETIADLLQRER